MLIIVANMYLINVTKTQRVLINKAKSKLLEMHPSITKLNDGAAIIMVLNHFVGGAKNGRRKKA